MSADQLSVQEVVALARQKFNDFMLFQIRVSGATELASFVSCFVAFKHSNFESLIAAANEEGGLEALNDWLNSQLDVE